MSYIPIDKLLKTTEGSIYKLVLLASKRALELNAGAPKLVESDSEKFSSIALEEIGEGKIDYKRQDKK